MELKTIAIIHTDFPSKFGLPRQAGLSSGLEGTIEFLPEYRDENAVRGLEGFSYLWVLWGFSENYGKAWSPTVRPPVLGGNEKRGVFATRSPFRPNPIGISSLRILSVLPGPRIVVENPDMVDGTPVFDIKPYVPFVDSHPEARGGFTAEHHFTPLQVDCPALELEKLPPLKRAGLLSVLRGDPRPAYIEDGERVFGFVFAGHEIKFRVECGVAKVLSIS